MNPEDNQNSDNNQPMVSNNTDPQTIPGPSINPDPTSDAPKQVTQNEINNAHPLPDSSVYTGMGGNDIKPEKKKIGGKIIKTVAITAVLVFFVVIAAYYFLVLPPFYWNKFESDGVTAKSPCSLTLLRSGELKTGVTAKQFACNMDNKDQYGISIANSTLTPKYTDPDAFLDNFLKGMTSGSAVTVLESGKTTISGKPAMNYKLKTTENGKDVYVTGSNIWINANSSVGVNITSDLSANNQDYQKFVKSIKIQ